MRKIKTTEEYTLDGHTLVELIANALKLPNGTHGQFTINFPLSYIIDIDEEGCISLFHIPECREDTPEQVDLSKMRVFVSTEKVEYE